MPVRKLYFPVFVFMVVWLEPLFIETCYLMPLLVNHLRECLCKLQPILILLAKQFWNDNLHMFLPLVISGTTTNIYFPFCILVGINGNNSQRIDSWENNVTALNSSLQVLWTVAISGLEAMMLNTRWLKYVYTFEAKLRYVSFDTNV
jgi:hypothetical protein